MFEMLLAVGRLIAYKAYMDTRIKWPFYTVSEGSRFSLQRKHARGLEESLMRSTIDWEHSLMNLNSHFELAYLRTLHVGMKKVHTKREGLPAPIKFFPDCV